MGYIGNEPTTGHFPVDNLTSSGGSTYTLSKAPASAGAIEVSVQGILQPTTAYSVSGTTLTLAGVANNVNIFVRHLGETLTLPTIADGVVTTTKLAVDAVDGTKLADNAVGNEHLEDDTVGIAELSATGTASNTTFLRGDNSWQTAGSTSASDLTSGILPMARLSGTLPALNGSLLTSLPASSVTTKAMTYSHNTANPTGSFSVTGVPFRPSSYICWAGWGGNYGNVSISFGDGTDEKCFLMRGDQTPGKWAMSSDLIAYHWLAGSANRGTYTFVGWENTGVEIGYSNIGTNSGTFYLQFLFFK